MKYVACLAAALFLAPCAVLAQDQQAAPGWITASNKPCKIWNPEPQPAESITWTGDCKDGLATGRGVVQWFEQGKPDAKFDGVYRDGKRNGPGTIFLPDGEQIKGVWVNDRELKTNGNAI